MSRSHIFSFQCLWRCWWWIFIGRFIWSRLCWGFCLWRRSRWITIQKRGKIRGLGFELLKSSKKKWKKNTKFYVFGREKKIPLIKEKTYIIFNILGKVSLRYIFYKNLFIFFVFFLFFGNINLKFSKKTYF